MAERRRGKVATFLIKVGAVTVAALIVLYAAKAWLWTDRGPGTEDPEVISWRQAQRHVGEFLTVEGTIVLTRRTEKACFLNFHPEWQHTFTAVIFARRFGAFPSEPEAHYRGKTVRVTGLIRDYQGKPEIVLHSPDQIEVIR
ncbi:MAG: hypothetical protein ACODAJ_06855 [Planctomycetota bacterium]